MSNLIKQNSIEKLEKFGIQEFISTILTAEEMKFNFNISREKKIENQEDLKELNLKKSLAKGEEKRILEITTEMKRKLDSYKKPILDFEKQIAIECAIETDFAENQAQDFKQRELKRQQFEQNALNAIRQFNFEIIQLFNVLKNNSENLESNFLEKKEAIEQKFKILNADVPIEETENAIEILENLEAIENKEVFIPIVEYETKNFAVGKKVLEEKKYSIDNEPEAIAYFLQTKQYHMLEIKLSKSSVNNWLKIKENQKHDFVLEETKLK